MGSKRKGDWIQTASGVCFYPLDPRPEDIRVQDIAHALSNQCRFSGHTRRFYSVAEHSVAVSELCDPADALWGLLHDASEAYLVDVPRPVKRLPELAAYRAAEALVMASVCQRFGLPIEMPASVERADKAMLWAEANKLMRFSVAELHSDWHKWREFMDERAEGHVGGMYPGTARAAFIERFKELTNAEVAA
jgi:hypothetical protein